MSAAPGAHRRVLRALDQCLAIYTYTYISIDLSIYIYLYLSIYLSIYIYLYLSIYIYLSIYLSINIQEEGRTGGVSGYGGRESLRKDLKGSGGGS